MRRFVAIALFVLFGACVPKTPAQQARQDLFDCRVRAYSGLLTPIFDAEFVMREIYAGRLDQNTLMASLGATQAEVNAINGALHACEGSTTEVLPTETTGS